MLTIANPSPLSYPMSKLLDVLLGAEIGTVYDKKKLIELLKVTNDNNDLEKEEVDIVTGALRYKEKTVQQIQIFFLFLGVGVKVYKIFW